MLSEVEDFSEPNKVYKMSPISAEKLKDQNSPIFDSRNWLVRTIQTVGNK